MNYSDFMNVIFYSNNPSGWTYDDELGRYVYKGNIAISIKVDRDRKQSFHEEWIERFPNKKAYNERFFLQYNGVTIEPFYCVSVDGGRAYLPFPNLDEGTVDPLEYNLVCILNRSRSHTVEYLKRAGFKVASGIKVDEVEFPVEELKFND